jgi:uncharacterized membrane protein
MLAAVALLPVTVFQAAMLSADGVTIALALLVLAQALDLAATPRDHPGTRHIATRRLVEIAATTIVLGFAKPPYILFALAFAIPWRRHGGRVRRAIAASVGAGFAAAAGWAAYASSVYVAPKLPPGYAGPLGPFTVYTHVDPGRQERFVAHHPLSFVKAIARTLAHFGRDLARQTVAQVPRTLPVAVAVAALMVLVVGILIPDPEASNGGSALSWRGRLLLLGIAGATFVTLMLLAYTGWNAVGAPRIDAFQGRYLLPLVPLVLLALPARRPSPAAAWTGSALAALSGALLVAVGIGLTSRFY